MLTNRLSSSGSVSVHAITKISKQSRCLSSSAVRQGSSAGGYDDGSGEEYAPASLLSPSWLRLFGFAAASVVGLSAYSSMHTEGQEPFLTRYLAHNKPSPETSKANADKLLALKKELADDTLLLSDAHRPRLLRMSNPGTFEQASPHKISPGSQADLSDLNIKSLRE
ncbi:hypothetical protein E3P94_01564 [Wallemia ichthyophaga]|nr:hypothetical protein E3P98_00534 [Wallemia ichthyophaga]TIB01169.1 hypothetical protein E3P95_01432 [Wallemia ichthyophaga]TIB02128.1 hypothetical protein E3P94_01564 [Wallemia ichthyophaga]